MAKDFAKSFYNSQAWVNVRNSFFIEKLGMCERCSNPGEIVHHKIYITPDNINDPNITLNKNNLELLCRTCHNLEHEGTSSTRQGIVFNSNGDIVEVGVNE